MCGEKKHHILVVTSCHVTQLHGDWRVNASPLHVGHAVVLTAAVTCDHISCARYSDVLESTIRAGTLKLRNCRTRADFSGTPLRSYADTWGHSKGPNNFSFKIQSAEAFDGVIMGC